MKHIESLAVSLFGGVLAFAAFFLLGSISGSGVLGFLAGALCALAIAFAVCRRNPGAVWYAGVVVNLVTWTPFVGAARSQIPEYLPGLVLMLIAAYAGAALGSHRRAAGAREG